AWKAQVADAWTGVRVAEVTLEGVEDRGVVSTGTELTVRARIERAGLGDADLVVEAAIGPIGEDGELQDPSLITLQPAADGTYSGRLTLSTPGTVGYTVRVTPQHAAIASRAELGLVATG
ncbi:MAG: alpha-glucan phosphorylase, partial [Brachybacterium sp.]|nr:alpha-glucan phosphorylase [Brachybacterium sp.]